MENPNATWNDFSTRIIQKDVSFQASSSFLNDEEQTKAQMATLGEEMKNLQSELKEPWVNAVEGNQRTVDPKKINTECNTILQLLSHKRTYPKLVLQEGTGQKTGTNRKRKDCWEKSLVYSRLQSGHGSEKRTRDQDFQKRNQIYTNDGFRRNSPITYQNFSPRPNFAHGTNHPNNGRSYAQRANQLFNRSDGIWSWKGSFNNHNGNWRNNGDFFRSPSTQRKDFSQLVHAASQEVISLTILPSADLMIDRRPSLQPTNKNFHKTLSRRHLIWFVSPPPIIPLTNYQTSVR